MKKVATFISILLMLLHYGCNKMDSTYEEFLKTGPIIYAQRLDSVKVYPGRNRVLITWLPIRDPRVSKLKIVWAGQTAPKELAITSVKDTSALVDGLPEGNYVFEFYTADDSGHSSIKTEALGITYDTLYERGLTLRGVSTMNRNGAVANISFRSVLGVEAYHHQEVTYTSATNGQLKTVEVSGGQSDLSINDFSGTSFMHRSVYKPQPLSPDFFYSPSMQVALISK
jgi:hypothetical protein